jgi:O-antigen/teichoic acid export membrane protein
MEKSASGLKVRGEVLFAGKASLIYAGGRLLAQAVGFIMIPVYTRFISPANYGAMELIDILMAGAAILVMMGMHESMARFFYDEKDEYGRKVLVSTIFMGFGILGAAVLGILLGFSGTISSLIGADARAEWCLKLGIVTLWFSMLGEVGFAYLRVLYRAKLFVAVNLAQLILSLALNIWFVAFLRLDITGIFYSNLIVQSLTGLAMATILLREVGIGISPRKLKDNFLFGLPLVPAQIATLVGFASNRFFLRWFTPGEPLSGLTVVGLYSLGNKFGSVIDRLIGAPINTFWGPRRMEILLKREKDSGEIVARIGTYATLCGVFFGLLLSAAAENLIEIIADPRYGQAHVVVPFIVLSQVFVGIERHFIGGLLMTRKTAWLAVVNACALCFILLWNYFLIPRWGLVGAATSNMAGIGIRTILIYVVSQRAFFIPFEMGRISTMTGVAIALYVLTQCIALSSAYCTLGARLLVASSLPIVLLFLGFYHKGEIEFVTSLLRNGAKTAAALGRRASLL